MQKSRKVRRTVEEVLDDIKNRGDEAVRELSSKFDNWNPEKFRLSEDQIAKCMKSLPQQSIDDIKFARLKLGISQKIQKNALRNVEVETIPGGNSWAQKPTGGQCRVLRTRVNIQW